MKHAQVLIDRKDATDAKRNVPKTSRPPSTRKRRQPERLEFVAKPIRKAPRKRKKRKPMVKKEKMVSVFLFPPFFVLFLSAFSHAHGFALLSIPEHYEDSSLSSQEDSTSEPNDGEASSNPTQPVQPMQSSQPTPLPTVAPSPSLPLNPQQL